jgi:23S rRNA (uridine2552-2'-O)-methyltransferase
LVVAEVVDPAVLRAAILRGAVLLGPGMRGVREVLGVVVIRVLSHLAGKKLMAKNKFNNAWLHDHINDPYVKQAQREGYRARAAYKLKEIDEQEKLLRPGMTVVDLGATPGSWSQYTRRVLAKGRGAKDHGPEAEGTGIRGRIIALDLLPMDPVADVTFLLGDFREDAVLHQLEAILGDERVDVVLSDMAPNLSGIELSDMARIQHVCELAMEFSLAHLKPEGALLVKAFHGSGYSQIIESFKKVFKIVKPIKPAASRANSSETFILARGVKKPM